MNYSDPQLQRLMLQQQAMQPYGGIANAAPWYPEYARAKAQRSLAMQDAGLRAEMQKAQIGQMEFNREMEGKRLGLATDYLDWRERQFGNEMDDAEKTMNLQTGLGLVTTGLNVWEKERRKKEMEAYTNSYRDWLKRMGGQV